MRIWHPEIVPYLDNKRLISQHYEITTMIGIGDKLRDGYYERENKRIPWGASVWVKWVYSDEAYDETPDGKPFTYHDWASNYHDFIVSIMEARGANHKSPLIREYNKISLMRFIEGQHNPPEVSKDYLMNDLIGLLNKWKVQDKRPTIPDEVGKIEFLTWVRSIRPYKVPETWIPGDPTVPDELQVPFRLRVKED